MKLSPTLKDNLRIEAPVNRHNLGIFPLVNAAAPKSARYLAFGTAHKAGAIRVTEVSEGGSVPQLAVEIIGKKGVLLIDGEELIGARQNRIVNLTILAKGNTQIVIPVSCVERGRWSYVSREFSESPRTMYARGRMKKMMNVSASLKESGSRASDQSEVWEEVAQRSAELGSHSSTEAMSDLYGNHAASVEEYMLGHEPLAGQIGAAFAIDGQVVGIELFETQDIAREYLPKVVRSYALDAIARRRARVSDTTAAADVAAVEELIEEVCSATSNEFAAVGDGADMRLDSSTVTGSALVKDGVVIHLSAFRKVLADISEPPKRGKRVLDLTSREETD